MTMTTHVDGSIAPGFEEVRVEFERNFAERGEIGAAVAAYWRGEKVVDLWGDRRTPEGDSFLRLDVDPNDRHYLAVEGPAGNGVGTARATARAYLENDPREKALLDAVYQAMGRPSVHARSLTPGNRETTLVSPVQPRWTRHLGGEDGDRSAN